MAKVCLALGMVVGVARAAVAEFPTFSVKKCGTDAVLSGTVCLDRYEASVWRVPDPTTTNASLVRNIRLGRATRAALTAGGATQLGTESDDYAPCTHNGQKRLPHCYQEVSWSLRPTGSETTTARPR
jgi:hypothetical protein